MIPQVKERHTFFRAQLSAEVTESMRLGVSEASVLWNILASQRHLPCTDSVPDTEELIWWGKLKDGTLFVSDLKETETGFTCQITLYPDREIHHRHRIAWINENLFGQLGWKTEKDPGVFRFWRYGSAVSFILSELRVLI